MDEMLSSGIQEKLINTNADAGRVQNTLQENFKKGLCLYFLNSFQTLEEKQLLYDVYKNRINDHLKEILISEFSNVKNWATEMQSMWIKKSKAHKKTNVIELIYPLNLFKLNY